MKLHTENDEIFGTDLDLATDFTIKNSPKSFVVLSKNIYKYSERAIIRELSTNATDTHKDAGTLDKPFKLHIPTTVDPRFICRDFGTGLCPDDVRKLITVYFASKKDQTDEYIGALGLGAKSPFSYTETFSIVSYFHGRAYGFTALMDNGLPKLIPTFEDETDEPNGLEITVPVKINDVSTWQYEAREILKHFTDHKPEVNINIDYMPEYDDYYVSETSHGVYAVMGKIQYPVPGEFYNNTWIDDEKRVYIKFDIGALDIMPSREEMHLSRETKKNLKNRIEEVNKKLMEKTIEKISALETQRKVAQYLDSMPRNHVEEIIKVGKIGKWDVEEIYYDFKKIFQFDNRIEGNVYDLQSTRIAPSKLQSVWSNSKYGISRFIRLSVNEITYIIDDLEVANSKARKEVLTALKHENKAKFVLMFSTANESHMQTLEHIKKYFHESEIREIKMSDAKELRKIGAEIIKKESAEKTKIRSNEPKAPKKPNVYIYTFDGENWQCSAHLMKAAEIRSLTGKYVINYNGDYYSEDDHVIGDIHDVRSILEYFGETSYISVRSSHKGYAKESGMTDLRSFLAEELTYLVRTVKPAQLGYNGRVGQISMLRRRAHVVDNVPGLAEKIYGKKYDKRLTDILRMGYNYLSEKTQDVYISKFRQARDRINSAAEAFKEKNPILSDILEYYVSMLDDPKNVENFSKLMK